MSPLYQNGDYVIVSRVSFLLNKPKVGNIAVLRDPRDGKVLIKRITGIENNKYFVEGDSKSMSTDSRHFGYLDRESIIGKVIWSSRFL